MSTACGAPWAGIFPSLPTAFAGDGALDLASQAQAARFAVECGAHGLLCFGLAGEVFRLTPDERREALEVIVEAVDGRIPVLAGVGAESLHTSLALARQARAAGADGVVIPPPVTTRPSRRELVRYFAEIATAAELRGDGAGRAGVPRHRARSRARARARTDDPRDRLRQARGRR